MVKDQGQGRDQGQGKDPRSRLMGKVMEGHGSDGRWLTWMEGKAKVKYQGRTQGASLDQGQGQNRWSPQMHMQMQMHMI